MFVLRNLLYNNNLAEHENLFIRTNIVNGSVIAGVCGDGTGIAGSVAECSTALNAVNC